MLVLTDLETADNFWMLRRTVGSALNDGIISSSEADAWLNDLKTLDSSNLFFLQHHGVYRFGRKRRLIF